jgi:hypothetical protein
MKVRKEGSGDAALLARWKDIVDQQKTFLGWPDWSRVGPSQRRRKSPGTSARSELHSDAAELTQAIVQLADADGVGLEGIRLRLVASAFRRLQDVTATLEVAGGRSHVCIARLDAWPSGPHLNLRSRRHAVLRHLPPKIDGSHVHRFEDNARLGHSAFGPGTHANLPVAAQIPGSLGSFRDFLRVVGNEFRIDGLDDVDPPVWRML